MDLLRMLVPQGSGPSTVFEILKQNYTFKHHQSELEYLTAMELLVNKQVSKKAPFEYMINRFNFEQFSSFNDLNGYAGMYPSGK